MSAGAVSDDWLSLATAQIRAVLAGMAMTIILMPVSARAFQMIGPGGASCGTWTADQRNNVGMYQIDKSWVLGFFSGIGYTGVDGMDPMRGLDANAVAAWIDNYCQIHPLEKIVDAALAFMRAHPR